MKNLNILGRPDGLGNRIEEIIIADAYAVKKNNNINYIWNNKFSHRNYPIRIKAKNINLLKDYNENYTIKNLDEFEINLLTKEDILGSAKNIKPTFNINFAETIKPIGIHIRGTDRINDNGHPHFMKNNDEFISYLSKTIDLINARSPKYVFVCADHTGVREIFIKNLRKEINIVTPVIDANIENEYIDFFSLSMCKEIYMCSKFSSFAITASMIGNIPVIVFNKDSRVVERYKALFQFELNIPYNHQLAQSIKERFPLAKSKHAKNEKRTFKELIINMMKIFRRKFQVY